MRMSAYHMQARFGRTLHVKTAVFDHADASRHSNAATEVWHEPVAKHCALLTTESLALHGTVWPVHVARSLSAAQNCKVLVEATLCYVSKPAPCGLLMSLPISWSRVSKGGGALAEVVSEAFIRIVPAWLRGLTPVTATSATLEGVVPRVCLGHWGAPSRYQFGIRGCRPRA